MCRSATISSPLRSKRATISPVRPRAKASGFTRISVPICIVLLGELTGDGHVPQRHDLQSLALEAGDDLAGQAACEGVGLYEDQRSVHWFLLLGLGRL